MPGHIVFQELRFQPSQNELQLRRTIREGLLVRVQVSWIGDIQEDERTLSNSSKCTNLKL